jgi:prepilin-type N-terminal cleavage/methylation domain-containing protein
MRLFAGNSSRAETATRGFTWIELIVVIAIISVLAILALPAIFATPDRGGQGTQMLGNMRQLHLATQTVALDGTTTGDTNLGWPGDTGGTFTNWAKQLVPDYLTTNDFCKLLSAPGKRVPSGRMPSAMTERAILVYAVSSNSPSDAVFLTTANFTNGPGSGQPLQEGAVPFGKKLFVVFRKGGDGAILLPKQVGNTNVIGSYVPLLK